MYNHRCQAEVYVTAKLFYVPITRTYGVEVLPSICQICAKRVTAAQESWDTLEVYWLTSQPIRGPTALSDNALHEVFDGRVVSFRAHYLVLVGGHTVRYVCATVG